MAEAIGLVDMAITRAQQLYDRYKTMKGNYELVEKLQKRFKKVKGKLRKLQRSTTTRSLERDWTSKINKLISPVRDLENSQGSAVSAPMPEGWTDNLDELISYFSEAATTLKTLSGIPKSRPKAFLRARERKGELEKLLNDFENLNSKTWLLDNSAILIQEIRKLRAPSTSQDIEFDPTFDVPENPSGVLVSFDDPHTMESVLKGKVLDESSTLVGAVGTKGASAVVVSGMSGMGKTSALRAIGVDKEVQDHYTGGVYFFELGRNATPTAVVEDIAAAVESTGGVQVAEKMRNPQGVPVAMRKAARWFASRRCLFIFDDLWRTESNPYGYFYDLKSLIPAHSRSCILFSTRDLKIAAEVDTENQVHFSQRGDDVAEAMLCGYAGIVVKQDVRNSFNSVIQYCGGLPIALAVAGRAVKRIANRVREPSSAWSRFEKQLKDNRESLGKKRAGGHSGLFRALSASLEGATGLPEFRNVCDEYSIQEIHRAFCVLKKPVWAPYSMLACLWRVTEGTAEKLAEEMEDLSLVNIEERDFREKSIVGVKLHDLVHDFCVEEAQNGEGAIQWHARLLEGYISRCKLSKQESEEGFGAHNWWSSKLEDDNYLHAHLIYHLAESRRQKELESTMLNFRWTYRQLKVNRFLTLKGDFELFGTSQSRKRPETGSEHSQEPYQHDEESNYKGSSCKASSNDNKGDQHSVSAADQIELIIGALRLSWPLLVSQEPEFTERELAFQMMGRLRSLRRRPVVDRYLRSVEREAERPCANPLGLCLEFPRGPAYGKFWMPRDVEAVSVMYGTDFAVAGDVEGNLRILNMKSMETVRSWRGHERGVTSVAVSGNGRRIVSGSEHGTVQIWNMETGEAVGEPLRGHENLVTSVAVSEDGQRIVSGSWDNTVRIWNMETGKAVGEPLRGHKNLVTSVAVSGDGERIVSGSWDDTVRIWNMETGEAVGEPLKGHERGVRSVAVSADGERIVSGSWDGTVRIWNMETGEAVGEPLRGHEDMVRSVAVGGDGERIVSGSWDDTVRIWNMETGAAAGEPLRGHERVVTSAAVSGDGQRIVSGSWDRTVRIWNMETGEAIGEPLRGHEGGVRSVAVSGDGERIVSGSWDRTVRIWNMETGEAVGEPLRGHEFSVRSVAVSVDGERIVSGSWDDTVRIWNMETGEAVGEPLRGHNSEITSLAVSGDSQRIVSGSDDGTVRIWNMETGEAIGEPLRGHERGVTSVAVSGDGQRIVSGSDDGTVRIWNMETGEAVGEPLERDETSVVSVARSGLLDEFIKRESGKNGARGEMESTRSLTTRTYCVTGHDGIYYGDIANGTDAMKIGSFESEVRVWLLGAEGKLWAGLANGTVAVVRTMK